MKKIASIVGISMISMAVALAPAFAQQTNPPEPSKVPATVQVKADEKALATEKSPAATTSTKSEKSLPAKEGTEVKPDNKATSPKPGTDIKSESLPSKPGTDSKAATAPAKPGTDMKTAPLSGKAETGVKDPKNVPVKSGADLKKHGTHDKSKDVDKKAATEQPVKPSAVK